MHYSYLPLQRTGGTSIQTHPPPFLSVGNPGERLWPTGGHCNHSMGLARWNGTSLVLILPLQGAKTPLLACEKAFLWWPCE